MPLSANERSRRNRIAALKGWDNTADRAARGRNAHAGLVKKFTNEAREQFPHATEDEIRRRTKTKLKLHYERMTRASIKARQAKIEARETQAAAMRAARDGAA
jgi:hypothetical protein